MRFEHSFSLQLKQIILSSTNKMIRLMLYVLIATALHGSLAVATGSQKQESEKKKLLKLDLNLPPPEEDTNNQSTIHSDHESTHHTDPSGQDTNRSSKPSAQTTVCIHNPACGHWKSFPHKERNKLYLRWHRLNRTEEQKIADNKSASIRGKKRYREFTEEQRKFHNQKSVQVQRKRLERMTPEERKKWHKKKNDRRRKSGQLQEPQDQ
ncbi:uncharacterized protein FA14DRAFT_64052 [Meira miltonrushii]|uniref:Uncharacterized protein n=1 Tax=Meira miltonrushii TaxID=1280837 RepID=A0A316V7Y7_9BASI|nr:uncharacterized protein FA14DRAFT_64052 [Meira miltonrushii]PWN33636.1 hypothetical protein FA14DRAFT_64052 [Meira miltonrushii]